jgi:uncharacterized membrane protein
MDAYWSDWLNLLLRWLHVVAAIAWIGESFYFVMLDNGLQPPPDERSQRRGVFGEMWSVHGGGFYHAQKYLVAPPELPQSLHWSFWKSYTTWLSGFALFTALYLLKPDTYLVDKNVFAMSPGTAVAAALGFLVAGWLVYDGLCRWLGKDDRILGVAVFGWVVAATYAATHLFAGRAAYLIVGAMLATKMSANVFFWIIPGQRKSVAAMQRGEVPDPIWGKRGKQRSVHNTYFTLPVVFAMISNHYPMTYNHPDSWLLLVLVMVAGAVIRHFFVAMHAGRWMWGLPPVAVGLLIAVMVLARPPKSELDDDQLAHLPVATYSQVRTVLTQRCTTCHAAQPTGYGYTAPPAGLDLDQEAVVRANVQRLRTALKTRYMPLGNLTKMTEDERKLVLRWLAAGAP